MHTISKSIVLASLALGLVACASSRSGDVYSREETRKVQTVRMGVIESVRAVKIEGTQSGIGTGAGAAVGGIAGSSVGDGKEAAIGAIIGAVVGGIAGAAAEEFVTRSDGVELTIKLDNGSLVTIVQEATEKFSPGEKVRLIESAGVTRVSH
jgi:outer membrane lipoprotein SlyB